MTRQRVFPFLERRQRLERSFKRAIVALTALAAVLLIVGTPQGWFAARATGMRVLWAWKRSFAGAWTREDWHAEWRARRLRDVRSTRATYRAYFDHEASPEFRRVLVAAGMTPDDAVVRWSNYDWTIVLSSKVFEADDHGRSYRFRPNTRACWTRSVFLPHGLKASFLLPDTPEVRDAAAAAGLALYVDLAQSTNSWGCRGAEPDLAAAVRVLVLGDSYMQGFFVKDHQTAPEYLRESLSTTLGVPVSVLNTGHLGYSPEQYDFTLREYVGRFDPDFVVVSLYTNDFGDARAVLNGGGRGWDEAKFWIQEIQQLCRSREIGCLLAAVPDEGQLVGRRNAGFYPGGVANLSAEFGPGFIDPTEEFVDETLRLRTEAARQGKPTPLRPLYNERHDDGHFSPEGAALWGRLVARRIARLLMDPRYSRKRSPELRARFGPGPALRRDPRILVTP